MFNDSFAIGETNVVPACVPLLKAVWVCDVTSPRTKSFTLWHIASSGVGRWTDTHGLMDGRTDPPIERPTDTRRDRFTHGILTSQGYVIRTSNLLGDFQRFTQQRLSRVKHCRNGGVLRINGTTPDRTHFAAHFATRSSTGKPETARYLVKLSSSVSHTASRAHKVHTHTQLWKNRCFTLTTVTSE